MPLSNLSKIHVGSEFIYRINPDWTLRNRFLATRVHLDETFLNVHDSAALNATGILGRNIFFEESNESLYTTDLDLEGKFSVLGTRHETLVGFDYLNSSSDYHTGGFYTAANPALGINIFNPRYGIDPALFPRTINTPNEDTLHAANRAHSYGVYFQDQITLFDKLHILGGGRQDWTDYASSYTFGPDSSFAAPEANLSRYRQYFAEFSPRVGVLYQPWPFLSVYGSWAKSFGAPNGFESTTGAPLPPQTGEQYEVGVKAEFLDRRLLATLAFYHLTKQNVPLQSVDLAHTLPSGESRSQGIELDLSGQITDNLSVIGSYAYADAQVVRADSFQGNRLDGVPRHAGSLWARYDFKDYSPLSGLSLASAPTSSAIGRATRPTASSCPPTRGWTPSPPTASRSARRS